MEYTYRTYNNWCTIYSLIPHFQFVSTSIIVNIPIHKFTDKTNYKKAHVTTLQYIRNV